MKFVSFNQGRIGTLEGDFVVDISNLVDTTQPAWPPTGMVRFIAAFPDLKGKLHEILQRAERIPLSSARLDCPISWPNKVIAFPANYHDHIGEMKAGSGLISKFDAKGQGFFLKSNSSLSGPNDPIVLPALPDREVHHECELALVIGKGGRDISRDTAHEHIFGYSCLVDVVIRGTEERVMRKSFDSFCPMGPHITSADEVPDFTNIDMELTVNGEMRQRANTRDLIVDIPAMISMASSVMTLYPGDIIASGTPAGVGPIRDGDRLKIRIDRVGEMNLDIKQGSGGAHSVWQKPAARSA